MIGVLRFFGSETVQQAFWSDLGSIAGSILRGDRIRSVRVMRKERR